MRPSWDELWMDVARTVALRSLCDRDQVGAVIVSATNRIVDTGYNGPPRGMTRIPDHPTPEATCGLWCPRATMAQQSERHGLALDYSDCFALHAEANALMFSDRRLREGGTIYVSSGTCAGCAKLVANSGLARAVYAPTRRQDGAPHRDSERWYEFLNECGLEVVIL